MGELLSYIEIESSKESLDSIVSIFESMTDSVIFEKVDLSKIKLCFVEAITNAIIHGNKMKNQKKVKISLISKECYYVFKIQDEGKGFEISELNNPLSSKNKLKCHGRGVYIMKQLCQKINFCNKSNVLELQFEITS